MSQNVQAEFKDAREVRHRPVRRHVALEMLDHRGEVIAEGLRTHPIEVAEIQEIVALEQRSNISQGLAEEVLDRAALVQRVVEVDVLCAGKPQGSSPRRGILTAWPLRPIVGLALVPRYSPTASRHDAALRS